MSPMTGILVMILLLGVNAFFVAGEFATTSTRRSQIEPLRAQRDRLHLELEIPDAVAADRVAAALASGGRVIGQEPGRWRLADPDGNEVVFLACDPVS